LSISQDWNVLSKRPVLPIRHIGTVPRVYDRIEGGTNKNNEIKNRKI
jgi:hypothetical protein